MTDTSGHNSRPDPGNLFKQFPADERDHVRKIWDVSAGACSEQPAVTEDEVEDALSQVHNRLKFNDQSSGIVTRSSDHRYRWKWMLAAAVILLVFGAGILLIPSTVTAPNGEITAVTLPDGSQVELNSGSRLKYNRLFSYTNRTVSLDGEAFFSVRSGDHSFIVQANNSTVKVTGTRFNVRSWNGDPGKETEVTVSEGAIQFYPECCQNRSVTVAAGQLSRWADNLKKPTEPEPASVDRILGWRDYKLIFNDKPLIVIFNELERRFDIGIRLENAGIGRETLTAYYAEPKDAESVLRDICRVKGLRYAETANGFRVYR